MSAAVKLPQAICKAQSAILRRQRKLRIWNTDDNLPHGCTEGITQSRETTTTRCVHLQHDHVLAGCDGG